MPQTSDVHSYPVMWYQGETFHAPPELKLYHYRWLYINPETLLSDGSDADMVWVRNADDLIELLIYWNSNGGNFHYFL